MDDKILIAGIKRKDKTSFDFTFNYYYSGLCAYVRKWVDSHEIAEDIVQDFFVKLWLNSDKLEISTSLKSYFFSAVKNRAIDYLKHQKVEDNYQKKIQQLASLEADHSDWQYSESELSDIIEQALTKLPPRCREIFMMSRFEGEKNAEIAEKLDISKRTVELQISNALKTLRLELKDYLPVALLFWLLK